MIEKSITIHDIKYFKEDINIASKEEIKAICSFLSKETELLWVQKHCGDNYKHLIDNILFSL